MAESISCCHLYGVLVLRMTIKTWSPNYYLHQVPFGEPLDEKLEGVSEDESLIFCKSEEETFCIVLEPCAVAKPAPHA